MYTQGTLFDIDELGGSFYGFSAYKILFSSIENKLLRNSILLDGDTNLTLTGLARQYCIAIQCYDPLQANALKKAISNLNIKGLCPLHQRFIDKTQVNLEPLILAAKIDQFGHLIECDSDWIAQAWKESEQNQSKEENIQEIKFKVEENNENLQNQLGSQSNLFIDKETKNTWVCAFCKKENEIKSAWNFKKMLCLLIVIYTLYC